MTTFATLSKNSIPKISTPHHHVRAVNEIKVINEIIENAGLDEETSARLVDSISQLTRTCVSDTLEKFN